MYKFNLFGLLVIMLFLGNTVNAAFQANHDVIFDGNTYPPFVAADTRLLITQMKTSKNGNRIVFYGLYRTASTFDFIDYKAFVIDSDGSNFHEIALPRRDDNSFALEVFDLAINDDGSIIYITTNFGGPSRIYRVDINEAPISSNVTQIADLSFLHSNHQATNLQTTSAGDWVYYYNSNNLPGGGHTDIYRLSSTGAVFETVVQDSALQLTNPVTGCQGVGDYVLNREFSVSGDGTKVLFRIQIITNNCMYQKNWWVLKTPDSTVLLNPENLYGYEGGMISTDGTKVVIADDDNYYSFNPDGSNQLLIEPQSYNYQGPAMTQDGSKYFYRDNIHPTGAIVNTDSSGILNILPEDSYYSPTVSLVGGINHQGNVVSYKSGERIYRGNLFVSDNVNSNAPVIDNIRFEPEYIIEGNTSPVAIYVTAHSVVGDIADVKIDNLSNDRFVSTSDDFSHHFRRDPQDNGFGADVTAGDGIYSETSNTTNNGSFARPTPITIRISVIDTLGNVKIIEKPLYVGIFTSGFE